MYICLDSFSASCNCLLECKQRVLRIQDSESSMGYDLWQRLPIATFLRQSPSRYYSIISHLLHIVYIGHIRCGDGIGFAGGVGSDNLLSSAGFVTKPGTYSWKRSLTVVTSMLRTKIIDFDARYTGEVLTAFCDSCLKLSVFQRVQMNQCSR